MAEYQVIARKWRPQKFGDVVGQEHVVRTLTNAIRQDRTAHAYLFVGPRGVGKTTLARIFAKAMNCEQPRAGEPCCECETCRAIAADNSMDVVEIDAASHNSAQEMRDLAEEVMHAPVSCRYKVYIIDEVHMLTKQAWNALLKTIEEPPAHVKFIFATTEVHQVLPTIISRCQRFDLLPIPTRLIAGRLQLIADTEKVKIEPSAVNAIARAAEGGMRDAQSLLDQMIAFFSMDNGEPITGSQVLSLFGLTDWKDLQSVLLAMLENRPGEVVAKLYELSSKGKNLETLYDDLLAALRGIRIARLLRNPGDILDEDPDTIAFYTEIAARMPENAAAVMLEILAPVGRVLHDAMNKQVYLETILLKAMREAHAVRLGDILNRLNQLRQAGELQFLDQLPPAQVTILPPAEKKTSDGIVTAPAAEPAAVPPEVTAPAPEVTAEPAATAVEEPAEVTAKSVNIAEEVPSQNRTEPVPESIPEPVKEAENVPENVPEVAVETIPEAAPPAAEPVPEEAPEENVHEEMTDAQVPYYPEEAEMTEHVTEEIPPMPEAPPPVPPPAPEVSKEDALPRQARARRRSVANDDPAALDRAARQPVIRDVLELFGGEVVDVHVKQDAE
ncbi:MAG: DNA polymerase III subunit gamma/tau [Lentisphaeria bacterium]|nr:DNA polymerase III subunit gamma/tau [Lentisphaeria bacterium]